MDKFRKYNNLKDENGKAVHKCMRNNIQRRCRKVKQVRKPKKNHYQKFKWETTIRKRERTNKCQKQMDELYGGEELFEKCQREGGWGDGVKKGRDRERPRRVRKRRMQQMILKEIPH